jgi:dynein heavy chain
VQPVHSLKKFFAFPFLQMERRLNAASRLIDGLSSERSRWSSEIKALEEKQTKLVGDCLLCASFLSYVGAFNAEYRNHMVRSLSVMATT